MQILPDGTVKIKNLQTGEEKVVSPGDLPQYVGNQGYNQYISLYNQQQAQKQQPLDDELKRTQIKQAELNLQQDEANKPKAPIANPVLGNNPPAGKPGHKTTQQMYQDAIRNAPDVDTQNAYADAFKKQYGYDVNGKSPDQVKQDQLNEKTKQASLQGKALIQNILDTFNGLTDFDKNPITGQISSKIPTTGAFTYNQQARGLASALAPVLGPGAGNGLRINDYEIKGWIGLLPQPGRTKDQNATSIISLDKRLKSQLGVGLDDQYLQQFGVTRDSKGNAIKANDKGAAPLPQINKNSGGNVTQSDGTVWKANSDGSYTRIK